jgi:hypothetical protein
MVYFVFPFQERISLQLFSGVYCQNCDIAPLVSQEIATNQFGSMALGVMPHAIDPQLADRLWRLSEQLTGTFYATVRENLIGGKHS